MLRGHANALLLIKLPPTPLQSIQAHVYQEGLWLLTLALGLADRVLTINHLLFRKV